MTDDLLQPTVSNEPLRARPWRVSSQFWVAFFGGVLPVTIIAIFNAERLGIARRTRWLMAACGALGLAVTLVLCLREPPGMYQQFIRSYGRIVAVVVYLVLAALQRKADAHHRVFASRQYASLWGAGLVVTIFGGAVQSFALIAAIGWLR